MFLAGAQRFAFAAFYRKRAAPNKSPNDWISNRCVSCSCVIKHRSTIAWAARSWVRGRENDCYRVEGRGRKSRSPAGARERASADQGRCYRGDKWGRYPRRQGGDHHNTNCPDTADDPVGSGFVASLARLAGTLRDCLRSPQRPAGNGWSFSRRSFPSSPGSLYSGRRPARAMRKC